MAAEILKLDGSKADEEKIIRAAMMLRAGGLVAFPTETVYGLGADSSNDAAVDRLYRVKNRPRNKPFALLVESARAAITFSQTADPVAEKLMRIYWPGPLTLVLSPPAGRATGFRCPAHPVAIRLVQLTGRPIAAPSANVSDAPEPSAPEDVMASIGDKIDLLLDGGPTPDRKPSTVVQVRDGKVSVLREGKIPADEAMEAAADVTLMVCTGNTCRSPMAEAMLRNMLASRGTGGRPRIVISAGTCAFAGGTADAWARQVMREAGISLEDHTTRALTPRLIAMADRIFAMTEAHRSTILSMDPCAGDRTMLLHPGGEDIPDPVGGDIEEYRRCRDTIAECLKARMEKI